MSVKARPQFFDSVLLICHGKFDCLIYEMLFIKELRPVRRISLKKELFRRFPGEIRSIVTRELQTAKSATAAMEFNRMPSTVYVASTFGLMAGPLRQKTIPADGLINSRLLVPIVRPLNSIALDTEPDGAEDSSLGGKARQSSEDLSALLSGRTAKIDSLEVGLSRLQVQILDLEASVESSMTNLSPDFSSPCYSSTPTQSCSSSCCLIEDKKNYPT